MKKKPWDQGACAVGCLVLAVVLAILLVAALPIIKSDPPPHTVDWLGFSGSVIGALMTLAAAGIAWFAVQRQIFEMRADKKREQEQEEFAARAMLPFALSSLNAYVSACIIQLNELPNPCCQTQPSHPHNFPQTTWNQYENACDTLAATRLRSYSK